MNAILTNAATANGSDTYSCSFSSIYQVLAKADQGILNITQVVQSCQNICSLAWGVGNPDLSGIGVSKSDLPFDTG